MLPQDVDHAVYLMSLSRMSAIQLIELDELITEYSKLVTNGNRARAVRAIHNLMIQREVSVA